MARFSSSLPRRLGALIAAAALASAAIVAAPASGAKQTPVRADTGCNLQSVGDNIHHVIYIQFDNTHFKRDNPDVPSDLEQMPHLLSFIRNNGTLLTNDHTVLISHTATGILSSLTGNYPDRFGQPISNSFRYFTPAGTSRTGVAFAYWTAPIYDPAGPPFPPAAQTDLTPEMINENGVVAPAPWVPYTRAGCDVGQVATANTVLENTGIDMKAWFGPGSAEDLQAAGDSPGVAATQTFADYVGIGVHCAQTSAICANSIHSKADVLTDEPGGYDGFSGLMGAKYVDPLIFPGGTPVNLDGATIQDQNGHVGFPGFDGMEATNSLSFVAHMQESGIPVTYAYISDAHDNHGNAGAIHVAYAPGQAGYTAQLAAYDDAFDKFFTDLDNHGINKSNTLFVFTVDEGDHYAGSAPDAACDGVTTPCTYSGPIGEINADLRRMIRTQYGDTINFSVHSDDAPNIYVNGQPGRSDPGVRQLEREAFGLHWTNPYTGLDEHGITAALADPVEMDILHMVTSDPARTPTFTLFADPDWFFFATGGAVCATQIECATNIPSNANQTFAWNHGDIQDEIASTWVGYVGPGIRNLGTTSPWTDHTDVRPTMLSLLGLSDDYRHDGVVTWQVLESNAVPSAIAANQSKLSSLAAAYKQIVASFGDFSMTTLSVSTKALASSSSKDGTYTLIESKLQQLGAQRDALALQISQALEAAEFSGTPISNSTASQWIGKANGLLQKAHELDASF
jgi:hypothetical protein